MLKGISVASSTSRLFSWCLWLASGRSLHLMGQTLTLYLELKERVVHITCIRRLLTTRFKNTKCRAFASLRAALKCGFFVIMIKYYVKKLFWQSCYDFHFSLYHCSRTLHSIDNSPKITPYYQRQVTKEKLISLYIL